MLDQIVSETIAVINSPSRPVRIFYRDPGVYGLVPPAVVKATVISVREHWSGQRFLIQPDGLPFVRDILAADALGFVWDEQPVHFPGGLTDDHAARLCWFVAHDMERAATAAYAHHHATIGMACE